MPKCFCFHKRKPPVCLIDGLTNATRIQKDRLINSANLSLLTQESPEGISLSPNSASLGGDGGFGALAFHLAPFCLMVLSYFSVALLYSIAVMILAFEITASKKHHDF